MRNIFEVASGLALGAAALGIGLTLVAMSYHASGFILSGAGLFVLLTQTLGALKTNKVNHVKVHDADLAAV